MYKTFQKNANYVDFLTKFLNTNNHTHHFLQWITCKKFQLARRNVWSLTKKLLFTGQIKRATMYCRRIFDFSLFLFIFNVKMLHTDRSAHVEPYILRCTVHTFTVNQNLNINLKILSLLFETTFHSSIQVVQKVHL